MDTHDGSNPAGQTDATISATATSETQNATNDLLKNVKGEFNRKISKLQEEIRAGFQALQSSRPATPAQLADDATNVDGDVKQYVSSVLTEQKQVDAWHEALQMFPELNPESENFDEKFYKAVDVEFSSNGRKDPKGPLKAAKLAALEMGKIEQLAKTNLLKDEARRSRILSEGSSTPREAKKEKDVTANFNVGNLARLGIKDPAKLAKRIKDNKDKYGA